MTLELVAAVVAVVALTGAALLGLLYVRRRVLTRERGAFDCSLRVPPARLWAIGVARFGSHEIEWWKVFSLSWRPARRWERTRFDVLDRRWPDGSAAVEIHGPAVLLRCVHAGTTLDLAMSADAYTGFASWLEAAPPGPTSAVT